SAGCKKDEPVVVHPRVSCCHRDRGNDNTYVKPSQGLEPKYGIRKRPQLSRRNPFDEKNARENAERLIAARRGTQYVLQLPPGYRAVTVVHGGPVITTRFRTVEGRATPPKPNGNGAQSGGSGCSSNTVPCYDSSRTMQERGRACAERLPTADEVFGPEQFPSLEERLRECERLNRDLETQLDDAMTPDHGRG
ncbi:MAG: hypothetical protein QME12_05355, partial [Nanoarchaeota archaeon]|nr:hypothetical protein [Nanoarchaeota archaeon]